MYNLASVNALRGDGDAAFEWLARAKGTGKIDVTGASIDPAWTCKGAIRGPRSGRMFILSGK